MLRLSLVPVLLTVALVGCGGSNAQAVPLQHGNRTPAAAGNVTFSTSKNGNNELEVTGKYLPIPGELAPGLAHYVVWVNAGRGPMPVGTLAIDKNRSGTLDTTTPYRDFDVLVTAEKTPAPARPSNYVVLRGQVGSGVAAAFGSSNQQSGGRQHNGGSQSNGGSGGQNNGG